MTFDEKLKEIKEALKNSVTADNAEAVASLDKQVDELASEHKALQDENTKLKDRIVDLVKNTGFKAPSSPEDNNPKQEPKNQDELFNDCFGDLINKK